MQQQQPLEYDIGLSFFFFMGLPHCGAVLHRVNSRRHCHGPPPFTTATAAISVTITGGQKPTSAAAPIREKQIKTLLSKDKEEVRNGQEEDEACYWRPCWNNNSNYHSDLIANFRSLGRGEKGETTDDFLTVAVVDDESVKEEEAATNNFAVARVVAVSMGKEVGRRRGRRARPDRTVERHSPLETKESAGIHPVGNACHTIWLETAPGA